MNLCGRRSDQVSILIALQDPSAVTAHEIATGACESALRTCDPTHVSFARGLHPPQPT